MYNIEYNGPYPYVLYVKSQYMQLLSTCNGVKVKTTLFPFISCKHMFTCEAGSHLLS